MKQLKKEDIKDFKVGIENGYFMWKVELKDNSIHQIKYKKVYFIRIDNEELIFDEELKKWFRAFRQPYLTSGI